LVKGLPRGLLIEVYHEFGQKFCLDLNRSIKFFGCWVVVDQIWGCCW